MKGGFIFVIVQVVALTHFATAKPSLSSAKGNVKYIDPLIGTDSDFQQKEYGGMIPSTGPPFAMTRWSAMTRINNVSACPYRYSDTAIHGFIGTHQPAIWMGEFGQVVVAPGVGNIKTAFGDRGLSFTHDQETVTPYYYRVAMNAENGHNITAETTATSRVGSIRFSFDERSSPHVIVDATRENIEGEIAVSIERREIYGRNPERQDDKLGPFKAKNFNGYFVARFDQPFCSWGTIANGKLYENKTYMVSAGLSAYVKFQDKNGQVNVRVGTSFISIDQARKNLENEIPDGTTLEETSRQVESLWAEKLDRVNVEGASQDKLTILYTGMFHSLQYPNEKSESNETGTYYYSGYDDSVHKGEFSYTGYSIWDIFRAEWAFLIMFAPERIPGMITSMLQTYKESGRLPMWENLVETNIMVCTWSSSLIAEALRKGIKDFDLDMAWNAVWKDAMVPPKDDLILQYYDREENTPLEVRAGLTLYKKNGWVPAIRTAEAGTRTLEYAWADFSVAVVANYTGHKNESDFFLERSENYRHVFNNDTTFMEARMEDGSWNDDTSTWTEGNNWIYTFNVPHNFSGLRSLFNGTEEFEKKLDIYFQGGHNDQSNEPSHATPFAYLYANKPHKTQSVIRSLLQTSYNSSVDGLSGNEDCGQMSAWAFFNYLGFYPVNPSSGEYMIGTPAFDKVILDLPGREQNLIISAPGAPSKPYVKSLRLNGKNALSKPIITHEQLMDAKEISFEMKETPQAWGRNTL